MKREWEEPRILVQEFAANEYVAACGDTEYGTYKFVCDAGGGKRGDVFVGNAKVKKTISKKSKKLLGASNASDTVSVSINGDTTTIKITAKKGGKLSAADFVIDGVNYADSSRYTWKDQTGKVVDIQSLLSDNLLEEVNLTLTNTTTTFPESGRITKSVVFETSGNTTTISIRANVGDTLEASDFVYNGIDYRQYTWKKSGTDEVVDLNDLIGVPLTQELLNEIGTYQYTDENSSQNIQTAVGNINFYINIAGTWEKVTGTSIPVTLRRLYITQNGTTSYTYVITASQLESIYGIYGFRAADQEAGLTIFRHGTKVDNLTGSETAWADRRPFEYDGKTYVQLLKETPECNVYYLPGDALETDNREVEASKTLDSMVEANTLYSVKVENAEGTQMDNLPAAMYVLKGSTTDTITLPQPPEGYKGRILIIIGVCLIIAACGLYLYNERESIHAGNSSEKVLREMVQNLDEEVEKTEELMISQGTENNLMKEVVIDGYAYIGYLSIPALELKLPIMSEWDYTRLKIAPCRQSGSIAENNLVIAGHNYRQHFASLSKLKMNDEMVFTDVDDNSYRYAVTSVTIEEPVADTVLGVPADLILYTCTYGGRTRLVVRGNRND